MWFFYWCWCAVIFLDIVLYCFVIFKKIGIFCFIISFRPSFERMLVIIKGFIKHGSMVINIMNTMVPYQTEEHLNSVWDFDPKLLHWKFKTRSLSAASVYVIVQGKFASGSFWSPSGSLKCITNAASNSFHLFGVRFEQFPILAMPVVLTGKELHSHRRHSSRYKNPHGNYLIPKEENIKFCIRW